MSDERERQGIAMLFGNAAKDLFARALVITRGDRNRAEDLVQEVFRAAWEARHDLLGHDLDRCRAWLFVTLRNKGSDAYHQKRREVPTETFELELLSEMELLKSKERGSPARREALAEDLLRRAWEVIEEMPPRRAEVFRLLGQGWKTGEIATELGINPRTVREHYEVGRRKLNEKIGPIREIFADIEDDEYDDEAER